MLKINQIYKVKEGHEGKCKVYKYAHEYTRWYDLLVKKKESKGFSIIGDDNYSEVSKCNHKSCFTEDDLEPLEEEVKEKSLEDLEVRRDWKKMLEDINELVDNDFGFDLQFDEKEYTDKDVDKMRKIILSTYQISHCVYCKSCQNKYKYQISKQMSPSEAETLLEEKLGIKVKIK